MVHTNALRIFLIICFSFSFAVTPSFSLTESVNLFGEINSADIILNDIWIEPKNPKNGDKVTIYGSVYNAGIIPTEEVSDAVTIAYIVNGEIVEINLLENVLPGLENGIIISSGQVFNAISGEHTITTIINYHDTLSHLRDNQENNIVQKIFQIGTKSPSIINFETYQYYNDETNNQEITIKGEITSINLERLENQEIIIDIEEIGQTKTISDANGKFLFKTNMPLKDKPMEIFAHANNNSVVTNYEQKIFPIKINHGQSALALEINSQSLENNLKDLPLMVVLFQDNYNNIFGKKSTHDQSATIENLFLMHLPSEHTYIAEIYLEGRVIDAFQEYFPENAVIKKDITILESSQIQFRIINNLGEPQNNVDVNLWIYSDKSDENGLTNWIKIPPTFTTNEPYVAQAIFPNGEIIWSEPFLIESEEKKVITIIKGEHSP